MAALPVAAMIMPRTFLVAARPLQRILVGGSGRVRVPPLLRNRAQQIRHIRYRIAKREDAAPKPVFTDEDIPPWEVWESLEKDPGLRTLPGLTTERMCQVVEIFCAIATHNDPAWQERLQSEFGIEPIVLHYTAATLWPVAGHKLSSFMMATASALGYIPSTVSLMRILSQINDFSEARLKQPFRDIHTRFRLLARTTRDPDILTVQGLIALREKDDNAALRFFEQAVIAAKKDTGVMPPLLPGDSSSHGDPFFLPGRPLRFAYEKSCYYKLGQLLRKKGELDRAREAFAVAATELRHTPALVEHARLVPLGRTAEENKYREVVLVSGAVALSVEASRQMVVDLLMKYEHPEIYSPKEFKEDPVDIRIVWDWCLLSVNMSQSKFPFANMTELEGVHKAIWSNRAKMSLVKQDEETGEVTLTIWVYPSRIPWLGNRTAEPERFDIKI
ncbi:hypothetical protein QBC41DRAFT_265524 [Cercophora samala]|uniref:Uncharacterized protein n=1 Tax=Cercophora samala TaxID=330535 RepID=A0AA39ZME8_9PEZI|nr:hypothetical protein QBC41DRAFT_265524 [Cercophora samala]